MTRARTRRNEIAENEVSSEEEVSTEETATETHRPLTHDQLVEKLRKHKTNEHTEPVELDGMLGIGKPISFGSVILRVPALTINKLTKALTILNEIAVMETATGDNPELNVELAKKMLDIIKMALERNYPDITIEELGDLIDLENMRTVFAQVLQMSNIEVDSKNG